MNEDETGVLQKHLILLLTLHIY